MDEFLVGLWEAIQEVVILAFVNWILALFSMDPVS